MGLIGLFLVLRSWKALRRRVRLLHDRRPGNRSSASSACSALLGTVLIAVIALLIAVPVSICTALFVTEYAPPRARRALTAFVDLLAAVPSLIYGLWGAAFLQPRAIHLSRWMATHLGFIPFFHVDRDKVHDLGSYPNSTFVAALVVALMIVPIGTAVMREVFSQAPPGEKEGASRWVERGGA
jgi:phosphate transport system permease protein